MTVSWKMSTRVRFTCIGSTHAWNVPTRPPDFNPRGCTGRRRSWMQDSIGRMATWRGTPLRRYIFYELHVGTFTPEGTFDGVADQLDELAALGITAVELMPVAQFPGERNWGYDGVYPFAVQSSYGGPAGLKRLVDACHRKGLAVVLDVVYNHLGPEGNYLAEFGPYFSDLYRTPWGAPLNFDGPHSDEVRRFFIENALYWITEFHIDALRLDAVHAIRDFSARPFLEELGRTVHLKSSDLGRRVYLIAESALNDTRLIRPAELGGMGLDAQWNDDFHHALHAVVTGERQGYYGDFGKFEQLLKALREGFVYSGEVFRIPQAPPRQLLPRHPADRLVVFAQNHDQVGNRRRGDRLTLSLPEEALKMTAGVILLSPYLPLLFMGEEYGETAPFPFFISHSDPDLIEAVRKGRRAEWSSTEGTDEAPDPQDEKTFTSAKLNHACGIPQGRTACCGSSTVASLSCAPESVHWRSRTRAAWRCSDGTGCASAASIAGAPATRLLWSSMRRTRRSQRPSRSRRAGGARNWTAATPAGEGPGAIFHAASNPPARSGWNCRHTAFCCF